jgi:hypothetical protein
MLFLKQMIRVGFGKRSSRTRPEAGMLRLISVGMVIFWAGGCVVPLPSKVSGGHKYSKEEIAFLDLPNTTREEVLSTLGEPLVEVPPGVLLYAWETTRRVQVTPLVPEEMGGVHLDAHPTVANGDPREWGLFVAYDERGYVTAHEVRRIGTAGFTQACVEWQQSRAQKR